MPICSKAIGKLPPSSRNKKSDGYTENSQSATVVCTWGEQFSRQAGVSWDLKRTIDDGNGTAEQKEAFAKDAADETPAPGLRFGDEAFWDKHDPASSAASNVWTCELTVRDGNLIASVGSGTEEPVANCQAEATRIARAMIEAMPG